MLSTSKSPSLSVAVVSKRSQLDEFPLELMMLVCSFLDSKQIFLLALVSPKWKKFVDNEHVLRFSIKQYRLTNHLESKSTHNQVFARMNAPQLKLLMRNSIEAQSQDAQQKELKAKLAISKMKRDSSQQSVVLGVMPELSFSHFVFNFIGQAVRKRADNELKKQLKNLNRTKKSVVTIETKLEDRKQKSLLL